MKYLILAILTLYSFESFGSSFLIDFHRDVKILQPTPTELPTFDNLYKSAEEGSRTYIYIIEGNKRKERRVR